MSVVKLTKDNFEEEVLNSKGKVLVDFYATWCGPCMMLSPIVDQLSDEVDFKVCNIDTDEAEDIARQFGIMSIPCVIAFKDGKEFNRSVGLVDKNTLLKLMEE